MFTHEKRILVMHAIINRNKKKVRNMSSRASRLKMKVNSLYTKLQSEHLNQHLIQEERVTIIKFVKAQTIEAVTE